MMNSNSGFLGRGAKIKVADSETYAYPVLDLELPVDARNSLHRNGVYIAAATLTRVGDLPRDEYRRHCGYYCQCQHAGAEEQHVRVPHM